MEWTRSDDDVFVRLDPGEEIHATLQLLADEIGFDAAAITSGIGRTRNSTYGYMDDNHVYQFIQNELGTSASRDGPRVRFKGRIPPKRIRRTIVNYVNMYIKCNQCGAPDTQFIKEDRTTLLKCQACGATRPVKL